MADWQAGEGAVRLPACREERGEEMARISVQVGDRFTRAGGSPKVDLVTALVDKPSHLLHARLLLEDGSQPLGCHR